MDTDRRELLERVAEMYYNYRLTQAQIAARTGYSRSMISRLITEAQDAGVVEFRIKHAVHRRHDLEQQLVNCLGLVRAQVLADFANNYSLTLEYLGEMAAHLVMELLQDHMTIGTSWGTGVYATVDAMPIKTYNGVTVVQTIGSLGTPNPEIDGPELVWRLAEKLSSQYSTLPVPLLVDSEVTRNALLTAPHVRRVMESFQNIDLALVGAGTVDPSRASLLRAGYLNIAQLDELRAAGAIGDVCAIHFDLQGNIVDTPLTRCIVGIDPVTLRRIPTKIGVAAGTVKAASILGAARAGFVNALVTDSSTANEVLNLIENGC